jgi:hypothetical protein
MNQKAKYLKEQLETATRDPALQRYLKITYCNLFCKAILDWQAARFWMPDFPELDFQYDIFSMNPGRGLDDIMLRTLTGTEYDNVVRMAASGISTGMTHDKILPEQIQLYPFEVSELQAHDYANQGIPVWACSKMLPPLGHEVIIMPTDDPYDEARGCLMAQAGWVNGVFHMADIFGEIWRKPESDIKYFVFPKI